MLADLAHNLCSTGPRLLVARDVGQVRDVLRRVEVLTLERERVVTELRAAGVEVTDCHGNFVWLPLEEKASEFGRFLEERGVVARPFDGDGVRVTVAEPPANDAFVQAAIAFAQ